MIIFTKCSTIREEVIRLIFARRGESHRSPRDSLADAGIRVRHTIDISAVGLQCFLQELTNAFKSHYLNQTKRYYEKLYLGEAERDLL